MGVKGQISEGKDLGINRIQTVLFDVKELLPPPP